MICLGIWFLCVVFGAAGFMVSARMRPASSARPIRTGILVGIVWCFALSTVIPASIVFSSQVWNGASIVVWEVFTILISVVFGLVFSKAWLPNDVSQ